MGTRLELHNELMNSVDDRKANNHSYARFKSYQITVIDRDPDSDIYDKIMDHFMMCRFERFFTSDNLNHWILNLYY